MVEPSIPVKLWRFHEAPEHLRANIPEAPARDCWLAVVFPGPPVDTLISRWVSLGWSVKRHPGLAGLVLVIQPMPLAERNPGT